MMMKQVEMGLKMGSLLSSCLKDEWTYNDDEAGEDRSEDGEFTKFMSDDGL